ncbi:MAG: T9SS type A sorting domain-containing protein [Bacteroidetes bacterium]|nr:T9SS type A sorting domain-containing protein [Bacteroidota bacterium]
MSKWVALFIGCLAAISVSAQSFNAYILMGHGASCTNDAGVLYVDVAGGSNYTYQWNTGATTDTISGLAAGEYTVTVYSGTDSVLRAVTLPPFGADTVLTHPACHGLSDGWAYIDNFAGQYPLQYDWYRNGVVLNQHTSSANALSAGMYQYYVTDAAGCVDSGAVQIQASSPVMKAYISDSILCYNGMAKVWFTPGFVLNNGFVDFYSTTDTFTYYNTMGGGNTVPLCGIDTIGCEACVDQLPFIYRQGHPDPVPLYQLGDTVSTFFGISLQPDTSRTYFWSLNGQLIDSSHYSFVKLDSSGFCAVTIRNEFGCTNFGSLQVYVSALPVSLAESSLSAWPVPATNRLYMQVPASLLYQTAILTDATGRQIMHWPIQQTVQILELGNLPAGLYFIQAQQYSIKVLKD